VLPCGAFRELEPVAVEFTHGRILHFTLTWQGVEAVALEIDARAEMTF
jgi:hypothetical protein